MLQGSIQPADYADSSERQAGRLGPVLFALAVLCFLPTGVFYFLAPIGIASSLMPGTIAACLIFLAMAAMGREPAMPVVRLANHASLAAAIAGAILVHLVGAIAVGSGTQPGRALLSLPLLLAMLGGGGALAIMLRQNAGSLGRAVALIRWVLVGLTLLAVADIHPLQGTWEKPIFPFSEPSHLALVLNPFLMHACIVSRGLSRGLWIAGSLALAYAAASLTMVIGMMLTALICLPLAGVVVAGAIGLGVSAFVDLSYFTDRLDFDAGTQNVSSLVYRQGWELVGDALQRTSGWGVGFQQLGYAPFRSASADALYVILRDDANTRDGGFLLAKIVSEFGVVGALAMLAYLLVAARATLLARRVAQGRAAGLPGHVVFALCVVCTFAVEMFVRDVGYFAGSVLLFLAALYVLWEHRSGTRRLAAR